MNFVFPWKHFQTFLVLTRGVWSKETTTVKKFSWKDSTADMPGKLCVLGWVLFAFNCWLKYRDKHVWILNYFPKVCFEHLEVKRFSGLRVIHAQIWCRMLYAHVGGNVSPYLPGYNKTLVYLTIFMMKLDFSPLN